MRRRPPGAIGRWGMAWKERHGSERTRFVPVSGVSRSFPQLPETTLSRASPVVRSSAPARQLYPAMRWLTARGITVYVLVYRLPPEGWLEGPRAPLDDARRALEIVLQRAQGDGIDPARIGLLGFSAGAHLMGMLATGWRGSDTLAGSPSGAVSPVPHASLAGVALIYPVITLEKPYDRTATRRALVGRKPDPSLARAWSVQTHVGKGYPPVFLVQADDDRIASPANAALMARRCVRAGGAVTYVSLPAGGHGFGMGRAGTPSEDWTARYALWLRQIGLLEPPYGEARDAASSGPGRSSGGPGRGDHVSRVQPRGRG